MTDDASGVSTRAIQPTSIHMLLWCPGCGRRHIDRGLFAVRAHHTHACQFCGMVWRPAIQETVGVQFLPGYRDEMEQRPTYEDVPCNSCGNSTLVRDSERIFCQTCGAKS